REVRPLPGEARLEVVELGELDLRLGDGGLGAAREDVEDEPGAVHELAAERLFEVAELDRREVLVEDDDVGAAAVYELFQLLDLPLADVGGGVELRERLRDAVGDGGPGGEGELFELVESVIEVGLRGVGREDADEEGAFAGGVVLGKRRWLQMESGRGRGDRQTDRLYERAESRLRARGQHTTNTGPRRRGVRRNGGDIQPFAVGAWPLCSPDRGVPWLIQAVRCST